MDLETAENIIGSLGYASKMPCRTYSLPAEDCIRGSKLHEVENTVCSKCYARRGNFARPTIQAGMKKRLNTLHHPQWVEAMVTVISHYEKSGYFRWHASGDLQGMFHLVKIAEVARRLPHIKFWLPTHEFGFVSDFTKAGFTIPDNLVIRLSADKIEQEPPHSIMDDCGVLGAKVSRVEWTCPAPTQDNECRDCRKCWDKRVRAVTYKYH